MKDMFWKLREALEKASDPRRIQGIFSAHASVIADKFLMELEKVQPDGTGKWVDVPGSEGRPSVRRGYTPIASGWLPPQIAMAAQGISLSIKSTSTHINWQRFGTPPATIPFGPTGVSFWWGPPLPWSSNLYFQGDQRFPQVRHPGIKPFGGSDFVGRAWREARTLAIDEFSQAGQAILFQPLREMPK